MVETTSRQSGRESAVLIFVLIALGTALVATTIPGPFSIDEINNLVTVTGLRSGSLFVPGTEGLTPSRELYSFDPEAFRRIASVTPVFSVAPPLYAPIALPFSFLGWRGLVLVNILAFLLTAYIVFNITRRFAASREAPWIAVVFTVLGGFLLEYSQGVWPHALSVFFVAASFFAAIGCWKDGRVASAFVAGILMGVATGIREQNIILAALLGCATILFTNRKFRDAGVYALGASIPLIVIATIHYFRQGLWHPFPKAVAFGGQLGSIGQQIPPLRNFWARIFDFSAFPLPNDSYFSLFYTRDSVSNAVLVSGVVKKALLQSAPWMFVALLVLCLVWTKRSSGSTELRRSVRIISFLVVPALLVLTFLAGGRTDGLSFNQRYFLELMPLAAVGLALSLDEFRPPVMYAMAGMLGSGILFTMALVLPSHAWYELALLRVPLVLAILGAVSWLFRTNNAGRAVLAAVLGLSVGWSALVHVFDDWSSSRTIRKRNAACVAVLESVVPDHSAIFTYGAARDAAGVLHLTGDVVVLDVSADDGKDAATLAHELRALNRRILVMTNVFPDDVMKNIAGGDSIRVLTTSVAGVAEILPIHSIR